MTYYPLHNLAATHLPILKPPGHTSHSNQDHNPDFLARDQWSIYCASLAFSVLL